MLSYKEGSLFRAPAKSVLAHGCNSQGVWGRGIAVEFKSRYPMSFQEYHLVCKATKYDAAGEALLTSENVGCLITSEHYSPGKVDSPRKILINTERAVRRLIYYVNQMGIFEVHSNKFNSGLFNVPWEDTADVLDRVLKENQHFTQWTVWTPR